jgi:hypothetical protein
MPPTARTVRIGVPPLNRADVLRADHVPRLDACPAFIDGDHSLAGWWAALPALWLTCTTFVGELQRHATMSRVRTGVAAIGGTGMARIGWGPLAAVLGVLLAGASVVVQRPGTTAVDSMCRRAPGSTNGYCSTGPPVGGWPFAFLYDRPGTSVLGKLGPEDDVRAWSFVADAAVYGGLVGALVLVVGGARRRRVAEAARPGEPFSAAEPW